MRPTGPRLILQTLDRQAQETLRLILREAGGDLRRAWALWETVKDHRAAPTSTSHLGVPMNHQSNSKPKPRYLSLAEYARLPHEPTEPYTSSPWEFDKKTLTLNLYETLPNGVERLEYQVDLERCANPAQVLDWIMHISEKSWATDRVLASLVRDLYLYLGPKICFGAGTTDVRATIRKQIPKANVMRGKRPKRHSAEGNGRSHHGC